MNNLRKIREELGLTQEELAQKVGTTFNSVSHWENGRRNIPHRFLPKIADISGNTIEEILGKEIVRPQVPMIGFVGAGARINFIDDHAKGDGFEKLDMPRLSKVIDSREIVAFRIKGYSMPPFKPDTILYAHAKKKDDEDLLNNLCIIKTKDGEGYVKELTKGSRPGTYTLFSYNGEHIQDVKIEWAYKIISIEPR